MKRDKIYWLTWYAGVLLFLLIEIVVFAWITKKFS